MQFKSEFALAEACVSDLPEILQHSQELIVPSPSVEHFSQADLGASNGNLERPTGPAFFDAVAISEALAIYRVVRALRPNNSVEVGFCCGGSGLAILQALEDGGKGTHHAIDPFQTSYARNLGRQNVAIAGLDRRLVLFEEFPEAVLPRLEPIQFAFIDASHLFDLTLLEFVLVDKLLEEGGIVGFHDTWMPAVQKVIRFILTNRKYELVGAFWDCKRSWRSYLKEYVVRTTGKVGSRFPGVFSPEISDPWWLYKLSNLAFLRKTGSDARDWRFFKQF